LQDTQRGVAFLPWLPVMLKALKPKETSFEPQTVGSHLRKKRLQLGLTQREAGQRLGVTLFTVINWEYGRCEPALHRLPAIREFLNYEPDPVAPITLAEHLAAKRRELGWTQKKAASALGVDPSTWSAWEAGGTVMGKTHRSLVARFTGLSGAALYAAMRKRWNDSHNRTTAEEGFP
jgi:transcriptional regulator with XRE-family HTH domain